MTGPIENPDALASNSSASSTPTADEAFADPDTLIMSMESVLERASRVEDGVNENFADADTRSLRSLANQVQRMTATAIGVIEQLSERSTHPLAPERELGDVRFAIEMAGHELRAEARKLAALEFDRAERKRILAKIAQAKGIVTKAFVNIERSLCHDTDRAPELARYLSLENSLETRRAYGKMRRALLIFERHKEMPPHDEVVSRLRRAGTSFVHLRGHDCYPMLRVEDRFQFEELWERVYGWLRAGDQDEQTYGGWLIWEDVINFVELLGSINFRQELREHDLALAGRALEQMEAHDKQDPVGADLADELARLTGYSAAIDELIEQGASATIASWRQQLHRIQRGI